MDSKERIAIWRDLETTDPNMTKKVTQGGRAYHSIDATWQFMRMTEIFGPAGVGWGYTIKRSTINDMGPAMVPSITTFEDGTKKQEMQEIGRTTLHTCEVELWYVTDHGERGTIPGIGHTKVTYLAGSGANRYLYMDEDYEKKSVTDAVTKAMSFIGMGADVRMGFYDNKDYAEQLREESGLTAEEQREADAVKSRQEFEEWAEKTMQLMSTALSLRELELIYRPAMVRVNARGSDQMKADFSLVKNTRARQLIDEENAKKAAEEEAKAAEAAAEMASEEAAEQQLDLVDGEEESS